MNDYIVTASPEDDESVLIQRTIAASSPEEAAFYGALWIQAALRDDATGPIWLTLVSVEEAD